jgi:hypothetical protein
MDRFPASATSSSSGSAAQSATFSKVSNPKVQKLKNI